MDTLSVVQEYKYVSLPPLEAQPANGENRDDYISRCLMDHVDAGWAPVDATRPSSTGQVGFLLRRT